MAKEEIKVGSRAPDFNLISNTGTAIHLSDYYHKSNIVLYFMREFT